MVTVFFLRWQSQRPNLTCALRYVISFQYAILLIFWKYFIGKYGRLESETCADVEILLWHDVVSNSISKHPYQATEPLSMHEFKEEVQMISGK